MLYYVCKPIKQSCIIPPANISLTKKTEIQHHNKILSTSSVFYPPVYSGGFFVYKKSRAVKLCHERRCS